MGRRRKRQQEHDFDDSLERAFSAKRSKPENDSPGDDTPSKNKGKQEGNAGAAGSGGMNNGDGNDKNRNENGKSDSVDDKNNIERLREKKRLKKLRQKEKKVAAQKEAERVKILQEKQRKEREKQRHKQKKLKELEKKVSNDTSTFVKTSMGVRYMDVLVGNGPLLVDRKKIVCQYILRAKSKTGKVLDSGDRFAFKFGKGEVIQGWEIGLKGMKQGGRRHIMVPPSAGYGMKDIGGGRGATLYFDVTLLQC